AGTANGLGGTENKTGLDRDYQPGPLGDYYYPVNEPLGFPNSLARLRDVGSRTALEAGLVDYTTYVAETPDNGTVDIGFHYPISNCNLLPLGFTINLEQTAEGYLEIKPTAQTTPLPFVNAACSGRGTVARIGVVPNSVRTDPSTWSKIVGEYYTTPSSDGPGNPSRTTVDRYGNVWVGNREVGAGGYGSVTKIGVVIGGIRCNQDQSVNPVGDYLKPDPALPGGFIYNTCVDRDRDGLIRTSRGLDHRLAWNDPALPPGDGDEAVIYYVRTTPTCVRSLAVDKDNNLWVGSRYDGWQELIDGATGAPITGQKFLYGHGGYGAVFDPYGVLWSSGYAGQSGNDADGLLWRPPGNAANVLPGTAGGTLPGTKLAYGIGIDPVTADVWLGDWDFGGLLQVKQSGCTNRFAFGPVPDSNPALTETKGIVVDGSGNVWVAHAKYESTPLGKSVYRISSTGQYLGRVQLQHPTLFPNPSPGVVGKSPHGLCIDSQQRVWAICHLPAENGKYYAMRIDPTEGVDSETEQVVGRVMEAVDLGTFPVGQGPYNYSDMSGFVTLAVTQPAGVWDYVKDGGSDYTRWSLLTLEAELYSGEVIVEVRAADRVTDLPAWPFHRLSSVCGRGGLSLGRLGLKGRYLEVRVTLLRTFGATQGPALKSLCLIRDKPGTDLQITQHPKSVIVDRGDPSDPAVFSVTATGTQPPLSYQWFKDG
ncbi:MAG TPA: two-component regulator propeller domain-containing protein, partial [Verrucomicrobiae bacterium]